MKTSSMIEREMRRSGGRVKIISVPASMRPTKASLKKLDRELSAQVRANEAMSTRSILYSSQSSLK